MADVNEIITARRFFSGHFGDGSGNGGGATNSALVREGFPVFSSEEGQYLAGCTFSFYMTISPLCSVVVAR